MGVETYRGGGNYNRAQSSRQKGEDQTTFAPQINQTSRLLAQDRNSNIELTKKTPRALKRTQLEYL